MSLGRPATSRRGCVETLVHPRVAIPVLLTVALLTFALSITNLSEVVASIRGLRAVTVGTAFALALVYLVLKGIEFRLLLGGLELRPRWRSLVLAYAIGEMSLTVPSGVYAQNYVLKRLKEAGFARSAAATSLMLGLEGTVIALTLLFLPVPSWDWLRPTIALSLAAIVAVAAASFGSSRLHAVAERLARGRLGFVIRGLAEMLGGLRALTAPRLLIPSTLLAGGYLYVLVTAFETVGRGVGADHFTLVEATTIYFFSLGVTMALSGFLTQLGVIEVAGLGVAQAWGYDPTRSLAMLLGFRVVWMGSVWLICGPLALLLRGELARSASDDLQEPTH